MQKKFLFMVDDGWRYDRREILSYLKGKLAFDVVTFDEMTYESMADDFDVIKLDAVRPRGLLYTLIIFFARELDTHINRSMRRIRFHRAPLRKKILYGLRELVGKLGLRRYPYYPAMRYIYRNSDMYGDLLRNYQAVVYSPVHCVDKRLLYEAKNIGVDVICWVYSWDNPMKENEFMPDAERYLVWNEETSEVLHRRYGVTPDKVDIVGPVQFDYLLEKKASAKPPEDGGGYIFYTCSLGLLDFYIEQEIQIILLIRRMLDEIDPDARLVVRPYPAAGKKDAYTALENHDRIEMVPIGKFLKWSKIGTSQQDRQDKFDQIQNASCLISLGSTIALEGSFTTTPVIQLNFNLPNDYADWQDISEIFKNEHLGLIIDTQYPNVASSPEELKKVLADIVAGNAAPYMPYSERLQKFANPLDVESYHEVFLQAFLKES